MVQRTSGYSGGQPTTFLQVSSGMPLPIGKSSSSSDSYQGEAVQPLTSTARMTAALAVRGMGAAPLSYSLIQMPAIGALLQVGLIAGSVRRVAWLLATPRTA